MIQRAANGRRLRIVRTDETAVRLRAPLNLWSFGERIDVSLGVLDGHSIVDITSTGVSPLQIADWGKNERNVRLLFREIDELLGEEDDHERCCVCTECGYLLVGLPAESCPECGRRFSPGEEPHPPETATFRSAAVLGGVLTMVEVVIGLALQRAGWGRYTPWTLMGGDSPLYVLYINTVVVFGIVGLHRIVKGSLRR